MKAGAFSFMLLMFGCLALQAQYPNHILPQYPRQWNSRWITHPDIDKTAHGMIHFSQKFTLGEQPEQFIVHVSGDNRYRLYVNNREVCYGPQLGDLRHWRYETLDLAPYLSEGQNIIAAEVINWGVERSYGIISFKTAFLLQGHSEKESFLNTGYNSNWKVWKNEGIYEKTVHWIGGGDIIGGFYAANPTDSIVASQYPWGWKNIEFDERDWKDPEIIFSQPKTNAGAGHGWILQPRTTATQKNSIEPFGQIIRSDLQDGTHHPSLGEQPLVIPANSHHKVVIDQGYVTLGYPQYRFSKGKDAVIRIKYSEAMYDANNQKGHRDETDGKRVVGISDVYVMDGGDQRTFQPIWFRTFRFIEVDVKTKDEPLILENAHNVYSAASFPVLANFETDQPIYDEVWDLCWHTMKICAQDNLMSDAYYEQMQYVGDLRPHLKGWTALTGDFTYFKSALEQFNNSRLPDGNITSCYPLKATFVHPTYSLIWIDMLHDLMMLVGDQEFIGSFTGEIQEVFDYYESLINENGLVGKSEYHMFVDWYLPKGGNSPVNRNGNSAILTLNYAYTLKNAAEILDWLGDRSKANHYRVQSRKYAEIARKLCFDEKRGLYADDPEKTFYDQRASILAALCDAHNDQEAKLLMQNALDDDAIFDSKANLFYYFYLFEAMEKTGVGNFTEQLQPWQDIVAMGMSGTPEKRIEQHPRSEIHPWTAHPVHYYFSLVAGIRPASPGFKTVEIVPNLGDLISIAADYPTVNGLISLKLNFLNGKISGTISLPDDVAGNFLWQGKKQTLKPGLNTLNDM